MNVPLGRVVVLILCMAKSNIIAMDKPLANPQKTFLALMRGATLDYDAFIKQADQYSGIGLQDSLGYIPMHYLLSRSDATIPWVDALLEKGARLDARGNPYATDSKGLTPYRLAVLRSARTPSEESSGKQMCPNKEVLRYVLDIILCEKLTILASQPIQLKYKALKELKNKLLEEEHCLK